MSESIQVAFVGNPNCGKTTLFNAYTGAKLKVANWPGVTVEKKEGIFKYHNHKYKLIDLPGIYSLTSYTMEEKLSRQFILESDVDVIVNVADASNLERNLYLTLQLIELGKPVILALNMMDIVEKRGMEIDLHRLPEMLGIPVIPVSARKKKGLDILMHAVAHHKDKYKKASPEHHERKEKAKGKHSYKYHCGYPVIYSDEIEDKIDEIIDVIKREKIKIKNKRWYAIKLLEQDAEIMKQCPLDLSSICKKSYETDIINQKYDFIEEIIEEVVVNRIKKTQSTDKADQILTNRYLGVPIFLGIMAIVFFLTFTIGDFLKGYFESGLEMFSGGVYEALVMLGAKEGMISLIVDGIIAGVGGILTFLPNIFILFLCLAFLEDSGYMSRVAYVMDTIMSKIGLSGRAFIPMLLGFGCTVPAIMASRGLEDMKDRRKTILVTPFMSCSARLPIYVLFSKVFFPKYAALVAFSMYLIGVLVAIAVAYIMSTFETKKKAHTLLIELPEYKAPSVRTILIYVWEKVEDYLLKAGTTIFLASILVWFLMNYGVHGKAEDITGSFGAILGSALSPFLAPIGLGMWQVVLALITGLAAKETVVSSFGIMFGISNINSAVGMGEFYTVLGNAGFGVVNAFALMVFCLLYTPCIATIGVIKREMKSTKWTVFTILFQLVVAWIITFFVYQVGNLLI